MSDTLSCTACGTLLRRVAAMTPGTAIQCPRCNTVFTAPELDGRAVAGITSQPTDAPPARVATLDDAGISDRPLAPLTKVGDGRWRVDVGRWLDVAMKHWGQVWAAYAGFFLVCALWLGPLYLGAELLPVLALRNFKGFFVLVPLNFELRRTFLLLNLFAFHPLIGLLALLSLSGGALVAVRQLTRQPWVFGDFFLGFTKFQPLFGWWLINQLISFAASAPVLIVVFGLGPRGGGAPNTDWLLMLAGACGIWLVVMVVYLNYFIRWSFTLYLIFDRDLGLFEAMATSWRMTRGHFWGMFGAYLVFGLIALIGMMMCYVGLLFAGSLLMLAHAAAYLDAAADRPYLRGEED
jgi:hypothetical protein